MKLFILLKPELLGTVWYIAALWRLNGYVFPNQVYISFYSECCQHKKYTHKVKSGTLMPVSCLKGNH